MDWQEDLDAYLAWTRQAERLETALAHARIERARALARIRAAGVRPGRIAWVVGLSKPRVNQLLALARAKTTRARAR